MVIENNPLVSVIIPVYNCDRYLAEAIESILAQTYQSIEVIVVDDGSTDGSADVAKHFALSVRYCYQPHMGIGATLNRGTALARGSFLAFLDADDFWVADKLMRQMVVFDSNPEMDIVFGHVKQFCSPELDDNIKKRLQVPAAIIPGYIKGTMLIKRDAFFRVGLFGANWQLGEFIDWYLRAVEQDLKSFMLPEVLLKRRVHDANTGIRERKSRTDYASILKISLDRRRKMDKLTT